MKPIDKKIILLCSDTPGQGELLDSEGFYIQDSEGNYIVPVDRKILKTSAGQRLMTRDGKTLKTNEV